MFGEYGGSLVLPKGDLSRGLVKQQDQIIAGFHKTRRDLNKRCRDMRGVTSIYPVLGDGVICLKNEKDDFLLNGMMGHLHGAIEEEGDYLNIGFVSEDDRLFPPDYGIEDFTKDNKPIQPLLIHKAYFDACEDEKILKNMTFWDFARAREFDFSDCITFYKSQGSQWDNVLIYDDGFGSWDPEIRRKALYTGFTRAVENVTIAK